MKFLKVEVAEWVVAVVVAEDKMKLGSEIYHFWGNNPLLYRAACLVTFLGKEKELRRRTVKSLELSKGDAVLDLACGTGLN